MKYDGWWDDKTTLRPTIGGSLGEGLIPIFVLLGGGKGQWKEKYQEKKLEKGFLGYGGVGSVIYVYCQK